MAFFRQRELPGVEVVTSTDYRRDQLTVAFDEASSTLNIVGRADALTRERISGIFDLETDRLAIERHLQLSLAFLPGTWCPFELGVRAILGQQISVAAARTLTGRLRARTEITPGRFATESLEGLGILPSRVRTLQAFAEAAQGGTFQLFSQQSQRHSRYGPLDCRIHWNARPPRRWRVRFWRLDSQKIRHSRHHTQ